VLCGFERVSLFAHTCYAAMLGMLALGGCRNNNATALVPIASCQCCMFSID
jgi:hypothetical protein